MVNGGSLSVQQQFELAQQKEAELKQSIAANQLALRTAINQNERIKAIRRTEALARQLEQARIERQRLAILARGGSVEQARAFAETQQASVRAGIGQQQLIQRGASPAEIAARFDVGRVRAGEQLGRQPTLAQLSALDLPAGSLRAIGRGELQAPFGAPQPSPFRAEREAIFARSRAIAQLGQPSREIPFRQVGGITQTLVTGRPEPFIGLSPLFAGRAATRAAGGVEVITEVPLVQFGDIFRPTLTPVARIPRIQGLEFGKAEVTQRVQVPPSLERPQLIPSLVSRQLPVGFVPISKEFGGEILEVSVTRKKPKGIIEFLTLQGAKLQKRTQPFFASAGQILGITALGAGKLFVGTSPFVTKEQQQRLLGAPETKLTRLAGGIVLTEALPVPRLIKGVAQAPILGEFFLESQRQLKGQEVFDIAREAQQRAISKQTFGKQLLSEVTSLIVLLVSVVLVRKEYLA
jgi:hypothetical protein